MASSSRTLAGISGSAARRSTYLPSNPPQTRGPWSVATVTQRTLFLLHEAPRDSGAGGTPPPISRLLSVPQSDQSEHQPGGVSVEVQRRAGVSAQGGCR